MTDPVKAKLIELVPDIELGGFTHHDLKEKRYRQITLADVLRAIWKTNPELTLVADGEFAAWNGSSDSDEIVMETSGIYFDLTTDYDNQTDELKALVGRLIGV